jgi:hypothetical protein
MREETKIRVKALSFSTPWNQRSWRIAVQPPRKFLTVATLAGGGVARHDMLDASRLREILR